MRRSLLACLLMMLYSIGLAAAQDPALTKNYFKFLVQRWADLEIDQRQRVALDTRGREAVGQLQAQWLAMVASELVARGEPVGLEYYRTPVPGTDWYYSGDILMIRERDGSIWTVDVIAGVGGAWLQGTTSWQVHGPCSTKTKSEEPQGGCWAEDWRDPPPAKLVTSPPAQTPAPASPNLQPILDRLAALEAALHEQQAVLDSFGTTLLGTLLPRVEALEARPLPPIDCQARIFGLPVRCDLVPAR